MSYFLFGLARTRRAAPRRGQPPPGPAYSCTNAIVSNHLPTPVPQSRTVSLSLSLSGLATTSGGNRSRPPRALATPPIANHRPRLTLMKASRGIDFDGALVPLFFSYIALFRCPGFPQSPVPSPRDRQRSHPLFLALSLCDELAELTGCEPVVQKRANI